ALQTGRVPVHLTGVQHRVATLADVDEGRLHARQDVLHAAEVHVARHGALRRAGDVVLDRDAVLEHRDLGAVGQAPDHHDPIHALATGQELRLGDDRASPTGLTALAAALTLGLEPGRTLDRGHLVLGRALTLTGL